MASRLMVQQQKMGEARPVNAANKQKNIAAAGKTNRRALGDIGNLVTVRRGKPLPQASRPVTRLTKSTEVGPRKSLWRRSQFKKKHATFMRLMEDMFHNRFPCIIVTGQGQPDVGRQFLKKMKVELKLPALALVDSDPYGLRILSVYRYGSKNMSYDSANLVTPDVKWLGVRHSDLDKYKIPEAGRLQMRDRDIKCVKALLNDLPLSTNARSQAVEKMPHPLFCKSERKWIKQK
ncbi:DNA topoisomerase 6 subunit A [Orobanche gracilis]